MYLAIYHKSGLTVVWKKLKINTLLRFYMAPEFLGGLVQSSEKVFFPPADMYSLGERRLVSLNFMYQNQPKVYFLLLKSYIFSLNLHVTPLCQAWWWSGCSVMWTWWSLSCSGSMTSSDRTLQRRYQLFSGWFYPSKFIKSLIFFQKRIHPWHCSWHYKG